MDNIVEEAYSNAISFLRQNISPHGLSAARPSQELEKSTYASLFSRDVGICTIGILASNDKTLIELAKQSLINLTKAQSKRGQFPQNFVVEKNEIHWWMPGTIDGTLWWSIAFLEIYKQTKDEGFFHQYKENLERAYTWLTYQDTNNDFLVEQGESAGWDDEMPRNGTVLYSNTLWYWLHTLRVEVEGRKDLQESHDRIKEGINTLLWVHKNDDVGTNYIPKNQYTKDMVYAGTMIEWSNTQAVYLPYYMGFSSHRTFEMRCDVFGNILACLTGVADSQKAHLFTDFVFRAGVNLPYPIKVMYPPIYPGEEDWRTYMAKGRQNYPWQYHNAGIWPFIGGFWIMWLSKYDKKLAEKELMKLAEANALHDWEFNEYLHGQHGTPMGIAYQSWNMAMYIAAYHEVMKAKERD